MRCKYKILATCLLQCLAHNKPSVSANLFSRMILAGVLFFDSDPSCTQRSVQSHHSGSFPKACSLEHRAVRYSLRKEGMGFCGQRGLEHCSGLSPKQHVQILYTKAELWMSVALQQQDQEFVNISPLLTLRLGRAEQEAKWKPIATGMVTCAPCIPPEGAFQPFPRDTHCSHGDAFL